MRVLANSSSSRTINESPFSDQRMSSVFRSSSRKLHTGQYCVVNGGDSSHIPAELLYKGGDLLPLPLCITLGHHSFPLKLFDTVFVRHAVWWLQEGGIVWEGSPRFRTRVKLRPSTSVNQGVVIVLPSCERRGRSAGRCPVLPRWRHHCECVHVRRTPFYKAGPIHAAPVPLE